MANKYTALRVPDKSVIEDMYNNKHMTQVEIGASFNTTQKVVYSWFKKLGIKSRVACKRNQYGERNHAWKGVNATYAALHYRVISAKGKADHCENCGRTDAGIVYDWANISGNYTDISDYQMLCRSCHFKKDGQRNNLPNRIAPKNNNKRKLIDGK